jgi:hypothetical protein
MAEKDPFDDKNFGASAEMQSQEIDWGMPGDYIAGTFVKARHGVETQFGSNSIYEIYAEKGSFHRLEGKGRAAKPAKDATVIQKGEVWSIWGRGDIFCGQMNSLRPGQVVKLQFTEEKDGKNGPWKDVKIFAPKTNEGKPMMNQEWLDTQSLTGGDM